MQKQEENNERRREEKSKQQQQTPADNALTLSHPFSAFFQLMSERERTFPSDERKMMLMMRREDKDIDKVQLGCE